ncbi:unnamed protein product [Dimorphilus gyrociliatus]|uniref:C1q domain-containing protein n=1 Tax=Dimorphilus gyrociliatus TaxID=2664684 RepID=A0A7I8WFL4_9ANNE|nr:unnamed protein product [Dimorphilus gyrociliatus]
MKDFIEETAAVKSNNPAFMVSLDNTGNVGEGRMNWEKVHLNSQKLFNPADNSLNITKSGMYFLSMTATVVETSRVSFQLDGTGRELGMTKLKSNNNLNTITRDSLFFLTALNKPYVQQAFDTANLTGGNNTLWTGFHYDSSSYFFGARDDEWMEKSSPIPLPIIMAMRGFRLENNMIKVSESGLYFVSFGSGFNPADDTIVSFHINDNKEKYRSINTFYMGRHTTHHTKSFLTYLHAGDSVGLTLTDGTSYADADLQTYLAIFKLDTEKPYFCGSNSFDVDKSEFVRFHNIRLDSHNSWNNIEGKYVVPQSGTYYVTANLPFESNKHELDIEIRVNGNLLSTFYAGQSNDYDPYLSSTSMLLSLSRNDFLQIKIQGSNAKAENQGVLSMIYID